MLRVLLLGCTCLGTTPAFAAVMQATITGTVDSVYDENDLVFGGVVSIGSAFSLTFEYDTEVGNYADTPTVKELIGGTTYGVPSPVSARFELESLVFPISGSELGMARHQIGFGGNEIRYDAIGNEGSGPNPHSSTLIQAFGSLPFDLEAEFTFLPSAGESLLGNFVHQSLNIDGTAWLYNGQLSFTGDKLVVERIDDVDLPSAVPLPATGLLLLGAVGAVGALGRRRPG